MAGTKLPSQYIKMANYLRHVTLHHGSVGLLFLYDMPSSNVYYGLRLEFDTNQCIGPSTMFTI